MRPQVLSTQKSKILLRGRVRYRMAAAIKSNSVELANAVTKGRNNRVYPEDIAGHDWYRFILSFPPHLVREYAEQFAFGSNRQILDPFCGTGTTLVESKKLGLNSVGIEAAPMAYFA